MLRPFAIAIGLGLILIAAVGFATGAEPWLCGADLCAGLWAFATVPLVQPGDRARAEDSRLAMAWPTILAMTLLLIGVLAVVARVQLWMTIATFAAAALCTLAALAASPGGVAGQRPHSHA